MRKFFLIVVLGLLVLAIPSCCKPDISFRAILKNTTDQEIELSYFENFGQVTYNIIKGKSETITNMSPPTLGFIDSVLVFSNGNLQEIHYGKNIKKTISNGKIISYINLRNLLNESNYQKSRKELQCNGSSTTYSYTF